MAWKSLGRYQMRQRQVAEKASATSLREREPDHVTRRFDAKPAAFSGGGASLQRRGVAQLERGLEHSSSLTLKTTSVLLGNGNIMPAVGDQHKANGSTTINPFEDTRPRMSEYTAQEIAILQSRLDKQLGPEYISSRPGAAGQKVHYLTADKAINLANEVFGFNGWSSSIQQIQIDFVDENPNGRISLGLSVIVRVTLKDGTFHEDVGYGHIENSKGKAVAFEKAKKEGTTDGLKRALRAFGNILGNCIYDKEFVAKVTKIKVAPSRFDADNLHRHHDHAPVKKELMPHDDILTINGDSCHTSHTETDDDFGIADFDDADFGESHTGHPDEVVLPADDSRSSNTTNASYPRTEAPTSGSATLPKGETMTPSKAPSSRQFTTPAVASKALPAGPLTASHPHHGMQPPAPHNHQPHAGHGRSLPPNDHQPSSSETTHPSSPGISSEHFAPAPPQQQPLPANVQPMPPVGFYSARAAPHVNSDGKAVVPVNIPKFDPHAESPSIRKTPGVDHNKTIPVKRGLAGITVAAAPVAQDGLGPRHNHTRDFVNPSTDMHRRIGAPNSGMPSPGAVTGSAYRPPTRRGPEPAVACGAAGPNSGTAKRAPLGDVSNMQQSTTGTCEGSDAKRQRITGPESTTEGNHGASAR